MSFFSADCLMGYIILVFPEDVQWKGGENWLRLKTFFNAFSSRPAGRLCTLNFCCVYNFSKWKAGLHWLFATLGTIRMFYECASQQDPKPCKQISWKCLLLPNRCPIFRKSHFRKENVQRKSSGQGQAVPFRLCDSAFSGKYTEVATQPVILLAKLGGKPKWRQSALPSKTNIMKPLVCQWQARFAFKQLPRRMGCCF